MQAIMHNGERVEYADGSAEALEVLRHSAAHIMAAAIEELYGPVEFGVGPAVENGFYYDMRLERTLTPDDFAAIEAKMAEIVKANLPFVRKEVTRAEALEIFASQPFKVELINEPARRRTDYHLQHRRLHRFVPWPPHHLHQEGSRPTRS